MIPRTPTYRLHKPTGQAVVTLNGRDKYLGKYGSSASKAEYDRLIAEWLASGRRINVVANQSDLTMNEIMVRFLSYADSYYVKNGRPTGTAAFLRSALRPMMHMYGHTIARDFGPLALKAVRENLIQRGWCRTTINDCIGRIKQMFKWAASEQLIAVSVYQALATVVGLRKGRGQAHEREPVSPVPNEQVEATLDELGGIVADMVRLQLLTGARPSEICMVRPCDVTVRLDGVWVYSPAEHKTEHHGRDRKIVLGPKAQDILRPYLDRDADQYCFQPADTFARRARELRGERKTPLTPSQRARRPKGRELSDRYDKDSYRRAIWRACDRAGIARWSPNRLRHSRATELRAVYGIEAAQAVLGHSDPKITTVYAERDFERAVEIMRQIG